MKLDDIDRADAVAAVIGKRLNNGIYNTMTWYQLNRGLFTALEIQRIGMSSALALIILVAACTVIATAGGMACAARLREGHKRAEGAPRRASS